MLLDPRVSDLRQTFPRPTNDDGPKGSRDCCDGGLVGYLRRVGDDELEEMDYCSCRSYSCLCKDLEQ